MIDDQHKEKPAMPYIWSGTGKLDNRFFGGILTLKVNEEGNLLTSIDLGRTWSCLAVGTNLIATYQNNFLLDLSMLTFRKKVA